MDIESYCRRIGYEGPLEPTLPVLNALIVAHVQSIPFENLDVLLGKPIALDEASLEHKLVRSRRGGYCFEQNGLFLRVLETLGFAVTPISARVRWQRPRDFTPPRTHLFLRLEMDGRSWLADVGVGGVSPTAALRLEMDIEQPTPHGTHRLIQEQGLYFHQVLIGTEWQDICEFTLEAMPPIDRELANWYTSAHPQSHFKNRLLVAKAAPEGATAVLDHLMEDLNAFTAGQALHDDVTLIVLQNEFSIRDHQGKATKHPIESPEALLTILAQHFGLHFPAGTRFDFVGSPWVK